MKNHLNSLFFFLLMVFGFICGFENFHCKMKNIISKALIFIELSLLRIVLDSPTEYFWRIMLNVNVYNNKSVRVNWQQCKCRDPIVNCIFSTAVGLFSWYMEYIGCCPVAGFFLFFFFFIFLALSSVSTLFCALSFCLCKWCEKEKIAKNSSSENENCVKTTSGT